MVHKVRFIVLFLISIILCVLCFTSKTTIEFNLLKTLLPQKIIKSDDVISFVDKSSSVIRVVFESSNEENLQKIKNDFIKQIDKNYFEINKADNNALVQKYIEQPTNFISDNTKMLLEAKKYDEIYTKALNYLYNPIGIQISSFEKDPYYLLDDFLLSLQVQNKKTIDNSDKQYDFMQIKIKNKQGLSPDIVNKELKKLISVQKELSNDSSKIYLAGSPIHSYYASQKSVISINIICILSTIVIIFLTYFYFKNLKLLIPIALSITFGMLTGYSATRLWFNDFQIITMVFSAALIGIGIDYSYHYFFAENINKLFYKNLTFSLLTSSIPFILLYLSGIELLKQISIYTIFGLFGIYFVVLLIYPAFKPESPIRSIKIKDNVIKIVSGVVIVLAFLGIFRFHFNDTLSALYEPDNKLKTIESLYNKISDSFFENTQIIAIKGENIEDIIQKEEQTQDSLIKNNIKFLSISKFMPSLNKQKENFELVKNLYNANLNKFSDILSSKQIKELKESKFKAVIFDIEEYPFLKDFMINEKTSSIIVLSDKNIENLNNGSKIINFSRDVQNCMENYRKQLLMLLPVTILILIIVLTIFYGFKRAIKILAPPLIGCIAAILISSLIMGELNLFSVITIYLLIGFTMDYSIFRTKKEKNTEDAILTSCLTTSFSFLLLTFCGFKLLSSIAVVLFFGIISSYFIGSLLFSKQEE